MNDHVSTLRIDLTGNLSAEAKLMGEALLKAMGDAKKLDEQLEQSGASRKMQDKLRNLGAGAAHVEVVTAALKAYKQAEDQVANGKDWTRDQINGLKSLEATTTSVIRAKINEEKQAHAQVIKLREEEAAAAKRFAEQEIAEARRVAQAREAEVRREAAARQRAHERELAEERRHNERIIEQRRETQHRLGFGHYVAGSAVAAVSAHGVVSGIEKAAEAGSELQDTRLALQRSGVDADTRARMEQQALQLSTKYGNVGMTAILELQKEARSVLRDPKEVAGVVDTLARAKSALDAGGGHSEGLGALVKGAESIGAANDPERLAKLIDGYVKAIQVMGKTINPEQIYEFDKYAKTAGATMSDRFLMTTGLSLSQEMGGSTAANDIFHAQKDIVGGFQNKHIPIQELVGLGLIAPGDVKRLHGTGEAKGLKRGRSVQGAELAQTDLDEWVYKHLLPALEAHGIRSEQAQLAEVNKIFTGGEADVISKLITQRESFENHAKLYGGAEGLAAADGVRKQASAGIVALTDALGNLMGTATVGLMEPAAKVMFTVADGLNALARAAAANPNLASGAFLVGGAAALYGAGKLGQMAMNGFGLGGGAAAAAEQTTAAGTQVSAAEMQLQAAGIEREAAVIEQTAANEQAAAAAKSLAAGGLGGGAGLLGRYLPFLGMVYEELRDMPDKIHKVTPDEIDKFKAEDEARAKHLEDINAGRVKDDRDWTEKPALDALKDWWRGGPAEPTPAAPPAPAPAAPAAPGPGDDSPAFVPMGYRGGEVPLARQPGFSRAAYTDDDGGGVDRGPVEGQGPDARLELAVAAGTEAGVLAAFARMKNDGTLSGVPGLSGGAAGITGDGEGGGTANLRYGRGGGGRYRGTPGTGQDYETGPHVSLGQMGHKFAEKAPVIMDGLMKKYGLTREQAAGVLGNLGHESGGFTKYHEGGKAPGQGGVGWAQWTGPRRRAFEAWTAARGLNPTSDEASWRYLTEGDPETGPAIAAVKQQHTAHGAAVAFEQSFERAGIKAYGSRFRFADAAMGMQPSGAAVQAAAGPGVPPTAATAGEHLADMKRNGLLSDEQCVTLAMASAGIQKGSGQLGANVHDWRRGVGADQGTLKPGDSVATFLNRRGGQSDLYAGGGAGTPGAGLDHAGVFRRYVMGPDGKPAGMVISEQYQGSGGVHDRTYMFGQGRGEHNGSNYSRVMLRGGGALGGGGETPTPAAAAAGPGMAIDHHIRAGLADTSDEAIAAARASVQDAGQQGRATDIADALDGVGETVAQSKLGRYMHHGEWCTDFVNAALEKAGIHGTNNAMAESFRNWGHHVDTADVKRGDVITMDFGKKQLQHTGFATGAVKRDKAGNITHVGMTSGNHDDKVISNYWEPVDEIHDLRRAGKGPVVPRTGAAAAPALPAAGHAPIKLFDHENTARTEASLKNIHRMVAGLGDASVSVLSGPRGATRGKARADVGRQLRGAPASTGTRIA